MTKPIALVGTMLAALGVIASLFLSWVWFANPNTLPEQIARLLANQIVQEALRRYPELPATFGITTSTNVGQTPTVDQFFVDPSAKKLAILAQRHRSLSAWSLWFEAPRIGNFLWFALLFTFLAALGSGMCALIQLLNQRATIPLPAWFGCSGISLLAFILVISQIPSIDTLGLQNNFGIALVCTMTDSQL